MLATKSLTGQHSYYVLVDNTLFLLSTLSANTLDPMTVFEHIKSTFRKRSR